ncbi:Rho termination factor N-terminal domain-containing protein [Picosynechococcus sp. PCC 7117]|uniref:Rho termination factor N-terminal domain-containing protein n=1 Tax=Picosynechococcus sp. PCC 7117 TaxID=195498 RepID=UPI000810AFFD|nr:Rho termination factor N-terminal domain-containing protein [Picosynechococcus sp. PCC 7117]ANV88862.1 hypothetical protein AWQ22_14740 [Picosynechococcus sp. PCC 7117]
MTIIITATVTAAAVYLLASLVAFVHDSIAARRHGPQQAIATTPKPEAVTKPTTPQNPIETMNIRQLKKEASKAKIKGYSSMKKADLIAALT